MSQVKNHLISIVLLALTLIIFGKTLNGAFLKWDDNIHIYDNPYFNPPSISNISNIWSAPFRGLYTPVTYTLWGLIAKLSFNPLATRVDERYSPTYFHAINLLLHWLNSFMAFVIARLILQLNRAKLGQTLSKQNFSLPATIVALIFLLHPIQTEAVSWVTGLKDLLCGFFSFLALYHFISYSCAREALWTATVREKEKTEFGKILGKLAFEWRWGAPLLHYGLATLFYFLALGAKPSAVCLIPIVVLIYIRFFREKFALSLALLPWLLPWLLAGLSVIWVTSDAQSANIYHPTIFYLRPLVAFDAFSFYLFKIIIPFRLASDYGRTPEFLFQNPGALWIWSFGLIALLMAWIFRQKRSFIGIGLCLALFISALLPTLGLTPFVFQNFSTVADRYAYFAVFFAALAIGFVLEEFVMARINIRRWMAPAGAFLILLAGLSFYQSQYWMDSIAFFNHTIAVNPKSWFSYNNLGLYLQGQGQYEKALPLHLKAAELNSRAPEIHYNYGTALCALHRYQEAIQYYLKILESDPRQVGIHHSLAVAYAGAGSLDQAIKQYQEAITINPDFIEGHYNLGHLFRKLGRMEEATAQFAEVSRINPSFLRDRKVRVNPVP